MMITECFLLNFCQMQKSLERRELIIILQENDPRYPNAAPQPFPIQVDLKQLGEVDEAKLCKELRAAFGPKTGR
jgi:hypothetical protein